ncbi:MAG: type II secretion system F family protein [Gammaproteobacteria bacterium]|nr:type II secretion system F family protein [Gammaproteobacteria bacterium]MBU1654043.1 type II secretion system F family protein [Gammaproteobacteria bacterium]MBU1961747.1 type II secretion system F family protein [Gammaproteobacteria bacterium]
MAQKTLKKTAPKAEKANVFSWEGTDKRGHRLSGESRAANINMVRSELRRQGINPLKIRKKSKPLLGRTKRITPKDIAVFSRQMSTMMNAGVPLVQSFDIVGRGHEKPQMQELILGIKSEVEGGTSLANALSRHPLYFNELYCNLVHAGEQAGVLDTLLDRIATYQEKTETLKGKIKKAMFYPIAVLSVAIIVTAIILIFVIPQFKSLFESFGGELPAFTQMVINLSEFLQEWWWAVFGSIGLAFWSLFNAWKRSLNLQRTVDRLALQIPVIGAILHKSAIARFSRTLSTMFAAGVPLVEALDSVAGAVGNIVYGDAIRRIREDVATGQSLQISMKQFPIFPNMVIQMVAIGEESGSLDTMLSKVADFFEEEVDNAVDALSSLMEPLIMVILGTLIGGLVVAMYLPIFKMAAVV